MPRKMPESMSPPSIAPYSDELFATTPSGPSPNTTRSSRTNKRPRPSDDIGSAEARDVTMAEAYSRIVHEVQEYNRRFKQNIRLEQSTRPIDPIPTDTGAILGVAQSTRKASSGACGAGDSSQPNDGAVQARQEQREHHQVPRPSLSSTLSSSLDSQIPTIFSPGRPSDTQSVYSQVTTQSTRTTYKKAGKSCPDCVKLLTTRYFSEWKNHHWPVHCPQEGYYCLLCKLMLVEDEEQGTVFWQCKKCPLTFQDDSKAVAHFTDRSLPCFDRTAVFLRIKPWKDHLYKNHSVSVSCDLMMCKACRDTYPSTKKTHNCNKLKEWTYQILTSIYERCDDHPDIVMTTFDQVNRHFKIEHFDKSPRSRRNRTNADSTIADDESRRDVYSLESLDAIDPDLAGQPDHGYAMTSHATHAESEALCSQQSQGERQQCNAAKDPSVDLREMGRISTLQDLQYPQGDMHVGDETGLSFIEPDNLVVPGGNSSIREPPPLLTNVVTEDGKARFLKRQSRSF